MAEEQRADPVWMGRPGQRSLAEIHTVSGPGAGRIWPLGMGVHDIGSAPGSAIEIIGDGVPERGVQVRIGPSGQAWLVLSSDTAGSSHIRVDAIDLAGDEAVARRGTDEIPWPAGGDLVLGEVLLRVTSPSVADAVTVRSSDGSGYDYFRVPRAVPPVPGGRFRLPPLPAARPRFALWAATAVLAVAAAAIGMAWLLRSLFFLVFVLVILALAMIGWISGRRTERRAFRAGLETCWEDRGSASAAIRQAMAQERKLRCDTLMDPACAALTAIGPGGRLWERRRGDADHLVLRVGTVDQPSMIEIEDASRDDAGRVFRWNLPNVPLAVDMAARGVLGLVGDAAATRAMAGWMVAQAAVLHSPRELQICLLTHGSAKAVWDWVGRLPHAWSGPFVLVGSDPGSVDTSVGELVSVISARGGGDAGAGGPVDPAGADIIVVIDGAHRLGRVDGISRILAEGPALRVFSLCLDEQERFLPAECTGVVWCDPAAVAVSQQDLPDFTGIRPDLVTPAWCGRIAGSLTELHDAPASHR